MGRKTWANFIAGGTPLDATALNDLEGRIGVPVRCTLNKSGLQLCASPMTGAVKGTWDVAREDPAGMWNISAPGNIVIPETGFYIVTVCPAWNEQNSTGVRAYHLQVDPLGNTTNGVMLTAHHDSPAKYNGCYPFSWAGSLAATDVLSVWIYHEAGTNLNWGGASRPLTSTNQSRNCEITVARIGT